jgi:hypothetical protein
VIKDLRHYRPVQLEYSARRQRRYGLALRGVQPGGNVTVHYSGPQSLQPGESRAEVAFMLALDDPPGRWTLKAVDVVNGKKSERKLSVGE